MNASSTRDEQNVKYEQKEAAAKPLGCIMRRRGFAVADLRLRERVEEEVEQP
jgi:hypothetical protein